MLSLKVLVTVNTFKLVECQSWTCGEEEEAMSTMKGPQSESGAGGGAKECGLKSVTKPKETKRRRWEQRQKWKAGAEGRSKTREQRQG